MASADSVEGDWETQAGVDACLAATGVTPDQVVRWRREGLLLAVKQRPTQYRGSEVLFPVGTCAQISAASSLFKKKNRVEDVGLNLWRQGFPVDERHWRPKLVRAGAMIDRVLNMVHWLDRRFQKGDRDDTVQDRAAKTPILVRAILSRINRRLDFDEAATFMRLPIELALGTRLNQVHQIMIAAI